MMPKNRGCSVRSVLAGATVLFLIWGCASQETSSEGSQPSVSRGRMVVLPFIDVAQILGHPNSFRNPVTAKVFFTGQVDEDGAGLMTNALYQIIGQERGVVWGSYTDRTPDAKNEMGSLNTDHLAQLRNIGRREKADTVMAGYLYVFRDRTGGSYGVARPARVAFELVLIGVDTGHILWQGSFKETQKPLSEDLTQLRRFIKRGGRWISAREMGVHALREMLKSIPPAGPH